MKKSENKGLNFIFVIAFVVLTFLVWVPVYGSYGESGRIMGLPDWVFYALLSGVILFVLEWIYLFNSNMTADDNDVADILNKLNDLGN